MKNRGEDADQNSRELQRQTIQPHRAFHGMDGAQMRLSMKSQRHTPSTSQGQCCRLQPMLKMLILPVLLLAFVACETATSNVGENRVESGKTADLELVDWNWSRTEYGSRTLAGAVKNNTSKRFDYVSIQFNLFNGADEQVGSTLANVNNLDGGATWRFEALVLQDDAVSARVSDLNGF